MNGSQTTVNKVDAGARPPSPHKVIQRDWISKTLAGMLPGLAIALACSGLFSHLNPDMPLTIRAQLAMWMVAPTWLCIFGMVYFFPSGRSAWLWLGGTTLLVAGVLAALRLA